MALQTCWKIFAAIAMFNLGRLYRRKVRYLSSLLDSLALAIALFQQTNIILDILVGGIFTLGCRERCVRAFVVAAQHVGIALVVQNLDGRPKDANRLTVGAIGKIETPQAVVGGGKTEPGLGVARVLGKTVVACSEVFLAETQLIVGIAAEQALPGWCWGAQRRRDGTVASSGDCGGSNASLAGASTLAFAADPSSDGVFAVTCLRSVAAEAPLIPSVETVYSCFADARVTTTVTVAALSVLTGSLVPKSLSVTLRVRISAVSPALRSNSERLPTEDANHNFCASTVSTSNVDRLPYGRLGGTIISGLIDRKHARVLQNDLSRRISFFKLARENDINVIARQHEAADAFHVVDADCHGLHARLDQCRQRRALTGSVILRASTGSFASIEASTTRRPPDTMSWILAKAPLGKALDGQGTS